MARKHGWWMSALALSLAWVFAPPADAKSTLNCTVMDETDKPIGKQEFTLTSSAGKQVKKKTNEQGEVKFTGLDDGTYILSAEGTVGGKFEVSGNAEQPCKYTAVTAASANAKLQSVMQLVQEANQLVQQAARLTGDEAKKKSQEAAEKYKLAEENGKELIQKMPGEGSAHYVLSVAYAYEGKSAEAEPEVKKAADLTPEKFKDKVIPIQMQSLNVEAEVLKQKRDFAGAIKKYEAMLAVSPNDSTVYYNMAVALGNANNFDEAIKTIDKAIALKPDDLDARKLKATLQDKFLDQMNKKLEKK